MTIIFSPHLDDAVLSLGQFMASEPATVVTVLAGAPIDGLSEYDESSGFSSSLEAVVERRREDEKACAALGATPIHLDFLDRQYQVPRDRAAITVVLAEWMTADVHVWAPLGLGHPDHVLVAECTRAACPDLGELLLYEDFPYRTMWPEQVYPALERVKAEGFVVQPYAVPQGPLQMKQDAIACYRSQFPDGATDPCLIVPERAWRATR